MDDLDDPGRIDLLTETIRRKKGLKKLYEEVYGRYAETLARCPAAGLAVELGSGGGFVKEILPEVETSDVLPYRGVDRLVDATAMPFADASLRFIGLFNVLHHIPDVEAFFREADRALVPGGRVLIVDQNAGWISTPILQYLHHEPHDRRAADWKFQSTGPLSGANSALAYVVFERDRGRFERLFPNLRISLMRPHTPLRYWLAGGLKRWTLLPGWSFPLATAVDRLLTRIHGRFGGLLDIELEKVAPAWAGYRESA